MAGDGTSGIREIVAVVGQREERATTVAIDVARMTGAHLTGVSLAFNPVVPVYMVAAPVTVDTVVEEQEQAAADAQSAGERFAAAAKAAGVVVDIDVAESITGDGFSAVVRDAMLSDLAIIGQLNPDDPEPLRGAVTEALLFDSRLPTILAPYSGVHGFPASKVIIAWNGSATATRAVRSALPLLRLTKSVMIASVSEHSRADRATAAQLQAYLARHGIEATPRSVDAGGESTGRALLDLASEEDADWMVMGAYGHSRLREFLLGGATREILVNATLPVLLAH